MNFVTLSPSPHLFHPNSPPESRRPFIIGMSSCSVMVHHVVLFVSTFSPDSTSILCYIITLTLMPGTVPYEIVRNSANTYVAIFHRQ